MEAKHPEYLSGVCLLEARSGKVVAKQLFEGIGSCVAVSPDGRILAVAGDFGIELLRATDLVRLKTLLAGKGAEYGSGFCSVQFSPDGNTVLAGMATGQLKIFPVAIKAR